MWNMRQKVGRQDLAFLPFSWLFRRQLTSTTIKLMTSYVLLLLYLTGLINGKHYKSNKYLHCLSYPGATSQIWSFSTGAGRHREIGKYRAGAVSGSVAVCADINQHFLLFTPAASDEKPRGFVHHWSLWPFLCAIFCFPPTHFRELVVRGRVCWGWALSWRGCWPVCQLFCYLPWLGDRKGWWMCVHSKFKSS